MKWKGIKTVEFIDSKANTKAEELCDISENEESGVVNLRTEGGELKKEISALDGCIGLIWKPARLPLLIMTNTRANSMTGLVDPGRFKEHLWLVDAFENWKNLVRLEGTTERLVACTKCSAAKIIHEELNQVDDECSNTGTMSHEQAFEWENVIKEDEVWKYVRMAWLIQEDPEKSCPQFD